MYYLETRFKISEIMFFYLCKIFEFKHNFLFFMTSSQKFAKKHDPINPNLNFSVCPRGSPTSEPGPSAREPRFSNLKRNIEILTAIT